MDELPNKFDSYSTEDLLTLVQRVEQEISSRTLNEQREDILDNLSDFIHKGGLLYVYDDCTGKTAMIDSVQKFRDRVALVLSEERY